MTTKRLLFWGLSSFGALFISLLFGHILGSVNQADEVRRILVPRREKATFAGGCFWCMEPPFDELEGVISTTVGYTGGHKENPTYEDVSAGGTGHAEAIQILYDPRKVSYAELLDVFWRNIDPTVKDRQFCDVGHQYRTAIFYHNEDQKRLAEASKPDFSPGDTATVLGGSEDVVVGDPGLRDPFNLERPDFRPTDRSLAKDGRLVAQPPDDGFFEPVNFIGGVNPENDWTQQKWIRINLN